MTTIPCRLTGMRATALHNITLLKYCDAFYLNIPYVSSRGKNYDLCDDFLSIFPPSLKRKIIINRCQDVGPITKLLPTLYAEKDPRTIIVTLDDDVLLRKDISRVLLEKHYQHPNACLSFSGFLTGCPPFCWQFAIKNKRDIEADWLQGCHSQAFVRGLVNADKLCAFKPYMFKHDDHRIAGFLASECIKRISINENPCDYFRCDPELSRAEPISGSSDFIFQNAKICYAFRKEGLYNKSDKSLWAASVTGLIFIAFMLAFMVIGLNIIFPGKDLYFIGLFAVLLGSLLFVILTSIIMES
jgi:hypothetical protein